MDNNRLKLTKDQLNLLLTVAGRKLGSNPDTLKNNLEKGKYDDVVSKMNPAQAALLNRVLSNPRELEKVLSNPDVAKKLKDIIK